MRRQIAALLACVTALAAVPAFPAEAQTAGGGLRMRQFDSYAQLRSAMENGVFSPVSGTAPAVREVLPARYDMREQGLVTPVKNQGSYGVCWSFAAMASLESQLIRRHPLIDLSEWHLGYYAYSDQFGYGTGNESMEAVLNKGGNTYVLSPILTRGIGPVAEESCPFGDFDVLEPDAQPEDFTGAALCQVTDIDMLPYEWYSENFDQQIKAVQQAVFDGHAVSVCYQNQENSYSDNYETFYTEISNDGYSNFHAVTIVGWDDGFPAERFVTDPGRNGAWLVKNSWGSYWGDNGYFWISYKDASLTEFNYLSAEPVQVHDRQYRHDDYGFWSAFSIEDEDPLAYSANVFTASEDTWLTSVMFATEMLNESYSVQVYSGLKKNSNPTSGKASAATEGVVRTSGYHTVALNEPVFLRAGEQFSIVLRLAGESGFHIVCEASMEYGFSNGETESTVLTDALITKSLRAGQSYYSADGKAWNDMFDEKLYTDTYLLPGEEDEEVEVSVKARLGNLCIRGLTQDVGKVVFSEYDAALPSGTAVSLTCPGADAIYYTINGGTVTRYTEPIVITEDMTIAAYGVSGSREYPVYSQHYAIQTAQLSSLLDTERSSYLQFEQLDETVYTLSMPSESSLSLLPITTGEILCETAALSSGTETKIDLSQPALTFRVREEGMQESLYVIYFSDDIMGDVNLDGEVDAADAAEVLAYTASAGTGGVSENADAAWLSRADYNADGKTDASDASEILVEAVRRGFGGSDR